MQRIFSVPILCAVVAGVAGAQQQVAGKAVAGELPGTERWNVVFESRSFDLSGYRNAIRNNATAPEVASIVADLQQRAVEDRRGFTEEVESLGGRVIINFWLINAATIEIAPGKVGVIAGLPNVHDVQPDLETQPVAPSPIKVATDANHHNSDAEQALGNIGTGYGIAIVDTGQDSNYAGVGRPHRMYYINGDINNHSGPGFDGSRLVANVQLGSQIADDIHNHGTGVASITASGGWLTASSDKGHAPGASIVGYSICNSAGCGSTLAIEALGWQQAATDKVLYNIASCNMSYTSSPNPTDVSQMAIDAAALNADIVAVCAAANNGASTVVSSSTANGLAVAACDNSKVMASFSSRGPLSGDTQRFYPDITGNGVSTVMAQRDNDNTDWVASGTSMASPEVCGVAALVKSARPCLGAREIKAVLLAATESIAAQNPSAPYNTRNAYGMGYLRADLACDTARTPGSVVSGVISSTATPDVHTIQVVAGQQVSVALDWMRYVLTSTAWSDLSLTVKNGATVVASNDDSRNLYEVVRFTAPITGNLTVEVGANSLEVADVDYALAFVNATSADTAMFTTFGTGCAGSNGNTPTLSSSGLPRLGDNYNVNLVGGPNSASGVLFVGFSNTNWGGAPILPFDLTLIGGNGCSIYSSDEIVLNVNTDSNGRATRTLPTPCDTDFIGLEAYCQFILQDSVNPLGLISSNAGQINVGW